MCGAAVCGRAQPVKPNQELETGVLRPCEVETDSWRQAVAGRPCAGVALRQRWPSLELRFDVAIYQYIWYTLLRSIQIHESYEL